MPLSRLPTENPDPAPGEVAPSTAEELHALRQTLLATQQALAESQQRELTAWLAASRDTLTGLPNRRSFEQRASDTLRTHAQAGRSFCLLFLDLDGFKAVNDHLGHHAGDALLKVVGARLEHALRADDFVCRLGGDEFVCLLPNVQHEEEALAVSRKLITHISAPCQLGPATTQVRASVGAALYPPDGHSMQVLLARADQAMLWAKSRGAGVAFASQLPQFVSPPDTQHRTEQSDAVG